MATTGNRVVMGFVAVLAMASTVPGVAVAGGSAVGVHVNAAAGKASVTVEGDDIDVSGNDGALGAGLTYDSAVSGDKVVAYRVDLGAERFTSRVLALTLSESDTLHLKGAVLTQTAAIRVSQTQMTRVWVGPTATLGLLGGSFADRDTQVMLIQMFGGAAAGVNLRMGPSTSLSASGSLQAGAVGGHGTDALFDKEQFSGLGIVAGARVAILFQPRPFSAF